MNKYCTFNILWLNDPQYKFWLARDEADKHGARCTLCQKPIRLGKMGEYAVKSHMKSAKHQELVNIRKESPLLTSFLQRPETPKSTGTVDVSRGETSASQATLDLSVSKNDVMDAEILWCMNTIMWHNSYKSNEKIGPLFQRMFPCPVSKNFTCGEKKTAYVAVFGIAPFLKQKLLYDINQQDNFVVLFDESLNNTLQKKQMDIHVRYWQADTVRTVYFDSVFMGHCTSEDIITSVKSAIFPLNLSKIIQISMDGPNVNLKFLKMFQEQLFTDFQKKVLNVGTCALHTVHNSFQSGFEATGWEIDSFLICLYSLFKDSPARREDFSELSGVTEFPKKFVQHRWLENIEVMERALNLLPYVEMYLDAVNKKKLPTPSSKAFTCVARQMKDKLLAVKLHVSISIAKVLHPFLVSYQYDKPIIFFMAEDIKRILLSILQRYIKPDNLKNVTTPFQVINFDFENVKSHVDASKINLGFVAEKELKNLSVAKKVKESDVFNLRMDTKKFLLGISHKIVEKSPINLSLLRSLDCLNPRTMAMKKDNCMKKMKVILTTLVAADRVSENECDIILSEYKMFLDSVVPKYYSEFQEFDFTEKRLDQFFMLYMNNKEFSNLWKPVKMLLMLSHGQASVERGFSINKQIEVENMREETYSAQRVICDFIKRNDIDLPNFEINKDLRISVSSARQRYQHYLDKKKENDSRKRKQVDDAKEINELRKKKSYLEHDIAELLKSADSYAEKAEETNDMTLISKSNSHRRSAKEKSQKLVEIEKLINDLLKENVI